MIQKLTSSFILLYQIFLLVHFNNGLKLPSYLQACSRSDPNLNQCALEHGRAAIKDLVKGDAKYHIPDMMPLKIPEVIVRTSQLKITFKDVELYGLENSDLRSIKLDLPNNKADVHVIFPRLEVIGNYDIDGRILVLPIHGHGPSNITCIDVDANFTLHWKTIEKNGKQYFEVTGSDLEYTAERFWFRFDNLFNGDKKLGEDMNNLINNNWQDMQRDLGPAIRETVQSIIETIYSAIVKKVPVNDVFLP